jgi:DNA repair protein RecO (recombination protein O)
MHWSEPAFVLSFRKHGEHDAVITVLTRDMGRFAGLVRGGQSSKQKAHWQPGHLMQASWRARLDEQLGHLTGEVVRNYAAPLLHEPLALAALASACALIDGAAPERMSLPALYDAFADLLPLGGDEDDLARYVRFEVQVLQALGYGLDMRNCALTGTQEELAYVSPRTGRAVSRDAASPWATKLLPLPRFLTIPALASWGDILQGLRLTGHFMEQHVAHPFTPTARHTWQTRRSRLLDLVAREFKVSGDSLYLNAIPA